MGGGVHDALKLAEKVDLQSGEQLHGSGKVAGPGGVVRAALIEHNGAKSLRLGIGGTDFGTSDDEAGPWHAGPSRVTGIHDAGYTSSIDQAAAERLQTALADALAAAAKAQKDPSEEHGGPWGDIFSVEGSVPGQWADVHYAVYVDDPSTGTRVTLGAVPHGSGRSLIDLDGYQQAATFSPAETKKLLQLLDQVTGA